MILWNIAPKMIEARYDGRVFEFAPNERKRIDNQDICNHLIFKLKAKGLVSVPEGIDPEAEKKVLIEGLKERWRTLDRVVRNHRTMNKERESNKMTAEAPSEAVIEASEECVNLLEKIKELEGERMSKVDAYLNDDRTRQAQATIDGQEQTVETTGSFSTTVGAKGKKGKRTDAVSSPAN
jgi:hypothetical protein